ncbi:ATP-dependent DNA helicase [Paenibacillus sp. N1-5-1-14]|uniref:ATP-dependent DNA helicase n=1 Tax=Paenibacillus radicibacter TaxID=2972488 RepID=UPI002158DCF4|nr:ATP-dependent DNA helicase [Paenibacillus radicibacter]MCR8641073.1 ATP-dependent DNA helicase [Paenibacillus radicibacter]
MERYPFKHNPSESFIKQVSDFVADVFYDILPEAGFEVRDEQIYMAFQLERAYADKSTIFAEAGVGTGKTLVYLLYAICYARYTGKPAIIACADESLIEQLVKPEGDIAKLAQHLNMTIDARLGKSPDQYVCLNKLDEARFSDDEAEEDIYREIYSELPAFVGSYEALQTFYPYGDRKNYPHLNDELWRKIGWDAFQDCLICEKRHRCGQTLSREHYRRSADLIICSHDFYMEHVWTYEGRKREGQLPLLPDHSSVVFDEGHLLETAAQKALTYKLKHNVFEEIVVRLLEGEVREELAVAIDEAIAHSEHLFGLLRSGSKTVTGSDRKEIAYTPELLGEVKRLRTLISNIEEEIALEAGMFTLDDYQLRIVEEHLEMIGLALRLFDKVEDLISWVSEDQDGLTLVVMPRMVKEVLEERVFAQRMPIVFSSATLSVDGAFNYVADSLGISQYESFSVDSPYEYEEQMKMYAPKFDSEDHLTEKMNHAVQLLQRTNGRALLLFPSREEMHVFKTRISQYDACAHMKFFFEGDQEISHLISAFQNDEESILCAVTLWEGLDIPGPSLSNVIIWSLPFPPNDPVFMAKRKAVEQPFEQVDMPYMLLRLRQGMGRLIRTREDQGIITILGQELHKDEHVRSHVIEVLPNGVKWEESL